MFFSPAAADAAHLWVLTGQSVTALAAWGVVFIVVLILTDPFMIAYPRAVMQSGAMDDSRAVVDIRDLDSGAGAAATAFRALARRAHANRRVDAGEIYSGASLRRRHGSAVSAGPVAAPAPGDRAAPASQKQVK